MKISITIDSAGLLFEVDNAVKPVGEAKNKEELAIQAASPWNDPAYARGYSDGRDGFREGREERDAAYRRGYSEGCRVRNTWKDSDKEEI